MDSVERLLRDLNAGLSDESDTDPEHIIDNLEGLVLSESSIMDSEYCNNLLFRSENPPSLLRYLQGSLRDKSKIKAKVTALKFLSQYVKLTFRELNHYSPFIFNSLVETFRRESSSEVRSGCLLPVKNLLRLGVKLRCFKGSSFSTATTSEEAFVDNEYGTETDASIAKHTTFTHLDPDVIGLAKLYADLLGYLSNLKKSDTKSLACEVCKVLGLLVDYFPNHPSTICAVPNIIGRGYAYLESNLSSQFTNPNLSLAASALSCMDRCCFHFPELVIPDLKKQASCFEYLLRAVSIAAHEDSTRYAVCRKALRFLAHHAQIFRDALGLNATGACQLLFAAQKKETLSKHWCKAWIAFLTQISDYVLAQFNSREGKHEEASRQIESLYERFCILLNNPDDNKITNAEVDEILSTLAAIIPAVMLLDKAATANDSRHYSKSSSALHCFVISALRDSERPCYDPITRKASYLACVASMVQSASCIHAPLDIQPEVEDWLNVAIAECVTAYASFHSITQKWVRRSLGLLTLSYRKISELVLCRNLQLIISLTFARSLIREELPSRHTEYGDERIVNNHSEILSGADDDDYFVHAPVQPLTRRYLSLWQALLKPTDSVVRIACERSKIIYENEIGSIIYSYFLRIALDTLRKFNLRITKSEDGVNPIPQSPLDQDMLINMATLFESFQPMVSIENSNFQDRTILSFLRECARLSRHHLMISSLYRLISVQFGAIDRICAKYLDDAAVEDIQKVRNMINRSTDCDEAINSLRCVAAERRIYVLKQLETTWEFTWKLEPDLEHLRAEISFQVCFFEGELLQQALRVLFSWPRVVQPSLQQLVPALSRSLATGIEVSAAVRLLHQYVSLSLDDKSLFRPYLKPLLRLMDGYLMSSDTTAKASRKRGIVYKTQSVLTAHFSDTKPQQEHENDQRIVLRLLGRLGGENLQIVQSAREALPNVLAWNGSDCVNVTLKLSGHTNLKHTLPLSLAALLPRIVELSQARGGDKQLQVAAGESLHSITCFVIGLASTKPQTHMSVGENNSAALLKHILPAIISIATTAEELLTAEIFNRLLRQISHWLAEPRYITSPENQIFLDAILVGFRDEDNIVLRTNCSRVLSEHFSWSLRRCDLNHLQQIYSSSESLLSRLLLFVAHPSENLRSGAANTLIGMCESLNQNTTLLELHIKHILQAILQGLRLGGSEICSKELKKAAFAFGNCLENFSRVLEPRDSATSGRRSTHMTSESNVDFQTLISWLWLNVRSNNKSFRRCCMTLIERLSPINKIINLPEIDCHTHGDESKYISTLSISSGVEEIDILDDAIKIDDFVLHLGTCLDLCCWVLNSEIQVPSYIIDTFDGLSHGASIMEILSGKIATSSKSSELFKALRKLFYLLKDETFRYRLSKENITDLVLRVLMLLVSIYTPERKSCESLIVQLWTIEFEFALEWVLQINQFEVQNTFQIQNVSVALTLLCSKAVSIQLFKKFAFQMIKNIFDNFDISSSPSDIIPVVKTAVRVISICEAVEWEEYYSAKCSLIALQLLNRAVSGYQISSQSDGFEVGQCAIEFARVLKCPLTWDSNQHYGLISIVIKAGTSGQMFMDTFEEMIVDWAFEDKRMQLNDCLSRNISNLFEIAADQAFTTVRSIVLQLLAAIMTRLKEQTNISEPVMLDILKTCVKYFDLVPAELLGVLLTIDSSISIRPRVGVPISNKGSDNDNLRLRCLKNVLNALLESSCSDFNEDNTVTALQLLPRLLAGAVRGCSRPMNQGFSDSFDLLNQVGEAVDELVASRFPLNTQYLDNAEPIVKASYLRLLRALLDCMQACGSPVLVKALLPSLREGPVHRYYTLIKDAMQGLARSVDFDVPSDYSHSSANICASFETLGGACITLALEDRQDDLVRIALYEQLILPMLRHCPSTHILQFLENPLCNPLGMSLELRSVEANQPSESLVKSLVGKLEESHILAGDELENLLFAQICAYSIFSAAFDRCPLSTIKGRLNQAFVGKTSLSSGKELYTTLCKQALAHINWKPLETVNSISVHRLQSTAFGCLATVVSKTQLDEKFFDKWLFTSDYTVWGHIIDCTISYNFSIHTRTFPTTYLGFHLTPSRNNNIHTQLKSTIARSPHATLLQYTSDSLLGNSKISKRCSYNSISPQNLIVQSQLIDIFGEVRENESTPQSYAKPSTFRFHAYEDAVIGFDDQVIALELNDLNTCSAMGPTVRAIVRMHYLFGHRWIQIIKSNELPHWLKTCRSLLLLEQVEDQVVSQRNIRLFILRLLLNQPLATIVAPAIPQLFPAILHCCNRDLRTNSYNYFLRDVVFTFCDTWSDSIPGYECAKASNEFLSHLFLVVYDSDPDILRENIRGVAAIIKLWLKDLWNGSHLDITPLITLMNAEQDLSGGRFASITSRGSENVRKRLTGLELIHCLFESGLSPLVNDHLVVPFDVFLSSITFKREEVRVAAASVCGIVLSASISNVNLHLALRKRVESTLTALLWDQEKGTKGWDRVATCIRALSMTCPSFLSFEFFLKVSACFGRMTRRAEYLEAILLSKSDEDWKVLEVFEPFINRALLSDITTTADKRGWDSRRVPVVQLQTLRLLLKHADEINHNLIIDLFAADSSLRLVLNSKTNLQVRETAYDLLIVLAKRHSTLRLNFCENNMQTDYSPPIVIARKRLLELLLVGLTDPDERGMEISIDVLVTGKSEIGGIRKKICDFFRGSFGLAANPFDLLVMLMTHLFSPSITDQWLQYSTQLLLSLCMPSKEFTISIFENGLADESHFVPLLISNLSSNNRNTTLNPLFTLDRSQNSQLLSQTDREKLFGSSQIVTTQLFGTQQVLWSQLQPNKDESKFGFAHKIKSPRNEAEPNTYISSVKQFGIEEKVGALMYTQALLDPFSGRVISDNSKAIQTMQMLLHQSYLASQTTASTQSSPFIQIFTRQRVPVRFQKDETRKNEYKSSSNTKKLKFYSEKGQQFKSVKEEENSKRKIRKIRNFRDGDFPDIKVSVADILKPIESIAVRDKGAARLVMESLTAAIIKSSIDERPATFTIFYDCLRVMLNTLIDAPSVSNDIARYVLMSCSLWLHSTNKPLPQINTTIESSDQKYKELCLPVHHITEVALRSLNYHMGAQLIEDMLLLNESESMWGCLIRLYDAMGESDVVLGLASRLASSEEVVSALDAEFIGDYSAALEIYGRICLRRKLTSNERGDGDAGSDFDSHSESFPGGHMGADEKTYSTFHIDLWKMRGLQCVEKLCDWGQLNAKVIQLVHTETGQVDPNYRTFSEYFRDNACARDQLMPFYIKGLVNASDSTLSELERFIDEVRNQGEKALSLRRLIETKHATEVGICLARRGEWSRALASADLASQLWIQIWSGLHSCATQAKLFWLKSLQTVVELENAAMLSRQSVTEDFRRINLYALPFLPRSCYQSRLFELLLHWHGSSPSYTDPPNLWADISTGRKVFLAIDEEVAVLETTNSKLSLLHMSDFNRSAALASISLGNLQAAKIKLKEAHFLKKSALSSHDVMTLADVTAVCSYNFCTVQKKLRKKTIEATKESLIIYQNTLVLIGKLFQTNFTTKEKSLAMLLQAEIAGEAGMLELDNDPQSESTCIHKAIAYYRAAAELVDSEPTQQCLQMRIQERLARLCNYLLTLQTGNDSAKRLGSAAEFINSLDQEYNTLAELFVQSMVKGLNLGGSSWCRNHILRLIKVAALYSSKTKNILSSSLLASIPAWTLIPQASPLLGCLDVPGEGTIAANLLEKLALNYPRALYYQFRITSEFLGVQGRSLSIRISDLLQNNCMDTFVEALEGLTHPELRWNDTLKRLRDIAIAGSIDQVIDYYNDARSHAIATSWAKVGHKIGSYNRKCASKYIKQYEFGGYCGEKIRSGGVKIIKIMINSFASDVAELDHPCGKVALSLFSEWLADWDSTKQRVEIPGQYLLDCNRAPDPGHHEWIHCVDPQILVLGSMRKPKRIHFYGSGSGKMHSFLVKGGEDLRSDERIQLMFGLMNSIVATRGLSSLNFGYQYRERPKVESTTLMARTYIVIPMTSRVGLLEWVKDTIPLKAVVTEEMVRDKKFSDHSGNRAAFHGDKGPDIWHLEANSKRQVWVGDNKPPAYHEMYADMDQCNAVLLAKEVEELIPSDFLRRYLLGLSRGPEAFITLRKNFAQTLAASSVFSYVLGIGDRHLENLLLDMRTGDVVQIDFGMCFGMGTSILPIPELIPFRLSPQLRSVLMPLDGKGLLRQWMMQCFESLRADEGRNIVANALDVYLNDPLCDWMASPLMQRDDMQALASESASSSQQTGAVWEPRRRINAAVAKLGGVNPALLLLEDLAQNKSVQSFSSFDTLSNIIFSVVPNTAKMPSNTNNTDETSHVAKKSRSSRTASTKKEMKETQLYSNIQIVAELKEVLQTGEQVDALIALATDPNIVMRQWIGLMAWI